MADPTQARPILSNKNFQLEGLFSPPGLHGAHPSVAYFSSSPGGAFNFEKWQMWRGIAEAAKSFGINLFYISGDDFENSPQAVLYNLVGKHNVDGIILWNSFFSNHSAVEKTQQYIQRYSGLPIVCIEQALDGACNLLIDNAQGVRDILAHLIEVHGYQEIAFLSDENSYTSRSRQNAFLQVMARYGLNPGPIGTLADFDSRGLRPGIDYRAIIAYSDFHAAQTIEVLQARGVRVPDDVAVTGFNDGMEARGTLPPLTTLRLPFRKQGQQAVEILARWFAGQVPQDQIVMPMQLILRRSCGCLEPLAEDAASRIPMDSSNQTLEDFLVHHRDEIITGLSAVMSAPVENQAYLWAESIYDSFTMELRNPKDGGPTSSTHEYIRKLNSVLRDAVEEGVNVSRWHEAITILRRYIRPHLRGQVLDLAEDLWQQARILIGQAAVRSEIHRSWKTSQRADILRSLESSLMTSVDFNGLLNALTTGLPGLGISNFFLVLYEDPSRPDGWAQLILGIKDGQRLQVEAESHHFHSQDILPPGLLTNGEPCNLVVEALYFEEQLGYMVIKTSPPPDASQCDVFQALRIQLSNAIKEVRLRQNLQDALQQAEEANLLKSRFLSMVSHELRTPINLIVGLSEMAMRQQKNDRKASLEVLQKFNEQIYTSGQHLDRLIRDVLDLASSQAGQMNLVCAPLNLVPVFQEVAGIGAQLAEQKNLHFRIAIPEALPQVWGDKTRLRQILLNLISNAVKFTAHGEVALVVKLEPGEILIIVEDTGLGIAKEEQESIFDEFHQSDRTALRGYGGIGLGLAITRRLVEMHGGKIWVTSNGWEGSGSRFCFTLPVLQYASSQAPKEDGLTEIKNPEEMVLVLTKAPGNAEKLVKRLAHHGFNVQEVALDNDANFIEHLVASPPGAVVLDLAPASEQGWDIMKKIKETPSTQDVPVLFFSLLANQDAGSVVEIDFLSKPIGTNQLIQALKRYGLNANRKITKTILIIDDEPGMLDLHTQMIQAALPECKTLTAQSGMQGLQVMRSILPDLVLLDLMMPEMDGFSVLKAIQGDQRLRNVPVIVLSAQVLTRREMDKLNQGVAAVLEKGLFSAKETIDRIECALSRNKRLGSESQRLVHHGMAFIHEHFSEPLSRGEIANHLCVNEQYLSRCFNKEIGIGPMAYLSRYRIQQAKHLLEAGTMSITQVALEVGFSSQSYFSRIFQQETGITPTDFQNGARPIQP